MSATSRAKEARQWSAKSVQKAPGYSVATWRSPAGENGPARLTNSSSVSKVGISSSPINPQPSCVTQSSVSRLFSTVSNWPHRRASSRLLAAAQGVKNIWLRPSNTLANFLASAECTLLNMVAELHILLQPVAKGATVSPQEADEGRNMGR